MPSNQRVQGSVVTTGAGTSTVRIPVEVINQRWIYAHFPLEWSIVDGEWLPELSRIKLHRGLNGQADDRNSSMHLSHIQNDQKKGVVISPSNPLLGPYLNYQVAYPARCTETGDVGLYYASAFERPAIVAGRNLRWNVDLGRLKDFKLHLVTAGIIPAISSAVIDVKIESHMNFCSHLKSLPQTLSRAESIKKMEDELVIMRKTYQAALKFEEAEYANEPAMGTIEVIDPALIPKSGKR